MQGKIHRFHLFSLDVLKANITLNVHVTRSHFYHFCITELAVEEGYHAEEYEIYPVVTGCGNVLRKSDF